MNPLLRVYRILLYHYGPQGWWPITPPGYIFPVYDKGPRTRRQRLEVVIGAILTQNTSWNNVEKAISQLNKAGLMESRKILAVSKGKLAGLIRSSGYYNQKAIKLKGFCRHMKKYKGNIDAFFSKPAKQLRKELLSLHGIGPETADSIVLYAAQKPSFVIDAYTKRIMSRYGLCSSTAAYDELKSLFEKSLKRDAKLFNEYHALLVRHAKEHCIAKMPLCNGCPLGKGCRKLMESG